MPLTRRGPDRQYDAVALTDQVDLRAEASLRAAQRMILRLLYLQWLRPTQLRRGVRIFFSPPPRRGWHG